MVLEVSWPPSVACGIIHKPSISISSKAQCLASMQLYSLARALHPWVAVAAVLFVCLLYACTGRVVFDPPLEDTTGAVLSVLEAAVLAAANLPRITPASISSTSIAALPASTARDALGGNPIAVPSMGLEDQLVHNTCNVSRAG